MGLLVLICLSAASGGCGSQSSGPEKASVKGTITYLGKPLDKALVVFMPQSANALPASGMTDARGRYELMTTTPGDGATPGKHRVTVTARGPDKELSAEAAAETGLTVGPGAPLIPEKYFMPDSSGLTFEVQPGGNTADFDLKD
jgi:hypothetical protein